MNLQLMYITNDHEVALIAQDAGVDRIFLDMEYIGKADRQGGMDTVQLHHKVEDVRRIRKALDDSGAEPKAKLMVRINPIHEAGEYKGIPHTSSKEEIDAVIEAGADILMLPYFRSKEEIEAFIHMVAGRATTFPLLESKDAYEHLDEILSVPGIDEIHIGLNDLSLDQGKTFMFEQISDGTVEEIAEKIKAKRIPFGFGGIAAPGGGMLPAEYIIREHHRLGSSYVILSRSFCNTSIITDLEKIRTIFQDGVKQIRQIEAEADTYTEKQYADNLDEVKRRVSLVVEAILAKRNANR